MFLIAIRDHLYTVLRRIQQPVVVPDSISSGDSDSGADDDSDAGISPRSRVAPDLRKGSRTLATQISGSSEVN